MSVNASASGASSARPENFYPNPFFDVAGQYLPKSVKATFSWCLYYQMTNPIINAITSKMSTYAITDLIFEDGNPGVNARLKTQFEDEFNIRTFLVETNLDRYTFGNSFSTVSYPIRKELKCASCKKTVLAAKAPYIWRGFEFNLKCSCGHTGVAKSNDVYVRAPSKIKLIRWNPANITMTVHEITGEKRYFYAMSQQLKNSITLGVPAVIEALPKVFIDAVRLGKTVEIASDKIFHSKRPSPSRDDGDAAWGVPLILPVLKDIFFLQILKKSQEAIALEHIVPMRILFPQVGADGSSPYETINLTKWQDEIIAQLGKWRRDPNHMPVMPLPVGVQNVGGEGKNLLLHQETRIYSEQIISGMGVPVGFFYGDSQYSGASINLRALENEFTGNRDDMLKLVKFIRDGVCAFMSWRKPELSFKEFKMADDLQRAAFDLSLVQQRIKTKEDFAQAQGINYAADAGTREKELKEDQKDQAGQASADARAQGEAAVITAGYQAEAQSIMGAAAGVPGAPGDPAAGGQGDPAAGGQGDPAAGGQGDPAAGGQQPQGGQQSEGPPEAMGGTSPMNVGVSQAGGASVDMQQQADALAQEIAALDGPAEYLAMSRLRTESPGLYEMVTVAKNRYKPRTTSMAPLPTVTGG